MELSMYRILVAIDGSERADRAAQFAIDLAKRIGEVEIHTLNVQDPVEESQTHGLAREAIQKHRETLATSASANALAAIRAAGVTCTFDWRFGDPAHVIVDFAENRHCNLIVMGTQGAGAIDNLLLGSVAQQTLHITSVPVTLVR
jgi:nucleotide-binding universal stress UspA family protein